MYCSYFLYLDVLYCISRCFLCHPTLFRAVANPISPPVVYSTYSCARNTIPDECAFREVISSKHFAEHVSHNSHICCMSPALGLFRSLLFGRYRRGEGVGLSLPTASTDTSRVRRGHSHHGRAFSFCFCFIRVQENECLTDLPSRERPSICVSAVRYVMLYTSWGKYRIQGACDAVAVVAAQC